MNVHDSASPLGYLTPTEEKRRKAYFTIVTQEESYINSTVKYNVFPPHIKALMRRPEVLQNVWKCYAGLAPSIGAYYPCVGRHVCTHATYTQPTFLDFSEGAV